MSEKRFFGFTEFSSWVSTKVSDALATVEAALSSTVKVTDDLGQYKVGELELSVLLAELATDTDLATLQSSFNDFVAAKATALEAVAGTDDVKYITSLTAKAAIEAAVNDLVGSSPEALNTIAELAAALENNPDVITELTTLVGQKLDANAQATDSAKLGGQLPGYYATADQVASKLDSTATAADSQRLGGLLPGSYATAEALAGKLGTGAQAADSAKLEGRSKAEVMADTKAFLALGTASKADIFVSTVDPISTDGKDGDLWIKYTA